MDVFMGTILPLGFTFAPYQWAMCQGQVISISQNSALFALLGTVYGGNGTSTFGLPNLQGRVPIGYGAGAGLSSYQIGEMGGVEAVSVLISNLPPHTHAATFTPSGGGGGNITATLKASGSAATQSAPSPTANVLACPSYDDGSGGGAKPVCEYNSGTPDVTLAGFGISTVVTGTVTNALTGSGIPLELMSPFLAVNYAIAIYGIFPTRN